MRNAIDECAATSNNFDEFQSKLLEQFQISVIEHRGRYSYLHPDRQKRITERALGTRYGKEHLKQTFLRKDPLAILYVRSHLRLVVNLQTNVKAMQSPAYAHRVKLSNLQQMANTIIYVQEHGFDTQSDLKNTLVASKQELKEMQTQFAQHWSDLRIFKLIIPFKERSSTSCPASFAPFTHSFASTSELLPPRKLVDMINTFLPQLNFSFFSVFFNLTYNFRRHSCRNHIGRNIFCYNCSGCNIIPALFSGSSI